MYGSFVSEVLARKDTVAKIVNYRIFDFINIINLDSLIKLNEK